MCVLQTVALMTVSMVTCTLMLAGILKSGKTFVDLDKEQAFMMQAYQFCGDDYHVNAHPPATEATFQSHWEFRYVTSTIKIVEAMVL